MKRIALFLVADLAVLMALSLVVSAGAQGPDRGAALDRAYDEVVLAQAGLHKAEEARRSGVEPLPGERLGTVSPSGGRHSRLSDEYWRRQRLLEENVEKARARLDDALARWNALR